MNRRRRMLIPVAVVLAAVLLLIFPLPDPGFLPQRGDQDETVRLSFRNLSSDVTYTGDEECAVCHETIYRSFAETGMGRSFTRPDPEKTVEDFSGPPHVTDEKTRFHYEAVWQGTSLFQVEYRLNDEGERTHELRRKVDYVIGSGNGTRSYISEENGFLTEMPITWYNQKGIWDLSPGYHTTNLRFSRPIVAECMHCHNSFTGYVNYSENRYSDVPLGIGCERCHGPGELHVNWRLSK
ncbi:MAG: multiheme c-type cytochrome, partial [Fidelibacterota bacterium]